MSQAPPVDDAWPQLLSCRELSESTWVQIQKCFSLIDIKTDVAQSAHIAFVTHLLLEAPSVSFFVLIFCLPFLSPIQTNMISLT